VNIQEFIKKLQNLPDKHKKIILWVIVAILAIAFCFFWFKGAMNKLSNLGNEIGKIQLPQIESPQMPEIETPVDEITDWKTYKNDEYGFEFKYPEDLKIKNNIIGKTYVTDIGNFKKPLFFFLDSINNKDILNIYNDEKNYPIPRMMWIESNERKVINGIVMNRMIHGSQDSKSKNIYISYDFQTGDSSDYHNIQTYLFVIYKLRSDDESERILDKMISTFKFTQ
jgi:hypothetical protein